MKAWYEIVEKWTVRQKIALYRKQYTYYIYCPGLKAVQKLSSNVSIEPIGRFLTVNTHNTYIKLLLKTLNNFSWIHVFNLK